MGVVSKAKREVKAFVAREFLVSKKIDSPVIENFRLLKCRGCDFYAGDEKDECNKCTCIVSEKVKSLTHFDLEAKEYRKTHCPEGKWNDKEWANYYRSKDGKKLIE